MNLKQKVLRTLLEARKPALANALAYHATGPHVEDSKHYAIIRERDGKPTDDPDYPRSKQPPRTVWELDRDGWYFGYYSEADDDEFGLFLRVGPGLSNTEWYNRLPAAKAKQEVKDAVRALNEAQRNVDEGGGSLLYEFVKESGWR